MRQVDRGAGVEAGSPPTRRVRVGEVELDLDGVVVAVESHRTLLTYREFLVLRVLMERAGEVVGREEILAAAWGEDRPRPRMVDVYVRRVRACLGDRSADDLEQHIRTVRGRGYLFEVPPRRIPRQRGEHPAAGRS